MNKNLDTNLLLDELGGVFPQYRPTYDFKSDFIDDNHRFYSMCELDKNKTTIKHPAGIPGYLRSEDALKIYEMTYFSNGDIVDFGTLRGLSTAIMSEAVYDSNNQNEIYTVEIYRLWTYRAKFYLRAIFGNEKIKFVTKDVIDFIDLAIKKEKKFGFVFVDHSHKYEDVYQVCIRLEKLIKPEGFCLFHDYNDSRNNDQSDEDYGVYQAVNDGLSKNNFEFYGIFGCSVLFKRI